MWSTRLTAQSQRIRWANVVTRSFLATPFIKIAKPTKSLDTTKGLGPSTSLTGNKLVRRARSRGSPITQAVNLAIQPRGIVTTPYWNVVKSHQNLATPNKTRVLSSNSTKKWFRGSKIGPKCPYEHRKFLDIAKTRHGWNKQRIPSRKRKLVYPP